MELVNRWNRWYDGLPELWRFPLLVGLLVVVGAINMALTLASGFPFGLLVLIAILAILAVRLPYTMADVSPPPVPLFAGPAAPASGAPGHAAGPGEDWAHHWNRWYDELPELWRFQLILGAFLLIGAINMALTIAFNFPFALLVLILVAAIIGLRFPYVLHRDGLVRSGHATEPTGAPPAPAPHDPGPALAVPPLEVPASARLPPASLVPEPPEPTQDNLPTGRDGA